MTHSIIEFVKRARETRRYQLAIMVMLVVVAMDGIWEGYSYLWAVPNFALVIFLLPRMIMRIGPW